MANRTQETSHPTGTETPPDLSITVSGAATPRPSKADELLRQALAAGPATAEGQTLARSAARRYLRAYRRHQRGAQTSVDARHRSAHLAGARTALARHLIAANLYRLAPAASAGKAAGKPADGPTTT
ncbi:MAG: hypothetical protein QOD07_2301, partial [Frankiaceae bacterium]|nr:hypothetical protein [Frankiaceae bacterium]